MNKTKWVFYYKNFIDVFYGWNISEAKTKAKRKHPRAQLMTIKRAISHNF